MFVVALDVVVPHLRNEVCERFHCRRLLLTERLGGATARRYRDLVLALIVNRVIAPASKLATVRALNPETAASSLGDRLKLGEVAVAEIYQALDGLLARQERIENGLAKRHLTDAGALRRELVLSRRALPALAMTYKQLRHARRGSPAMVSTRSGRPEST